MTRAYLFVATVRRRSGAIQAVTAIETTRGVLGSIWHQEQMDEIRREHPEATIIKGQSKDITDWVVNAAREIDNT